jgi:hypothetical protein
VTNVSLNQARPEIRDAPQAFGASAEIPPG